MRYTKEDKELKLFDKDDYALMMKSLEVGKLIVDCVRGYARLNPQTARHVLAEKLVGDEEKVVFDGEGWG
jgi:hypothetical protein